MFGQETRIKGGRNLNQDSVDPTGIRLTGDGHLVRPSKEGLGVDVGGSVAGVTVMQSERSVERLHLVAQFCPKINNRKYNNALRRTKPYPYGSNPI